MAFDPVAEEERRAMEGTPEALTPPPSRREEYLEAQREDEARRLAVQRHNEVMGALRRIYGKLLDIEKRVVAVERRAATAPPAQGPASGGDGALDLKAIASDRDLDGPKGDPTIKYDPKEKYWTGRSYVGYRFSETEPDYLDAMATALSAAAYMAAKDADEKKRGNARWKALDAARARGWAARLRAGWGGAPPAPAAAAGAQAQGATPAPARPPADEVML